MNSKKMPELDFSSPLSTAAFAMLVLLEYDESPENTIEMLNVLKRTSADERDGCSVFA